MTNVRSNETSALKVAPKVRVGAIGDVLPRTGHLTKFAAADLASRPAKASIVAGRAFTALDTLAV